MDIIIEAYDNTEHCVSNPYYYSFNIKYNSKYVDAGVDANMEKYIKEHTSQDIYNQYDWHRYSDGGRMIISIDFMNINVGDSIFIPNLAGGEKIWEFPITAINIVNGEPDIVVREEYHYKISDIGEAIYLNKKEAQIKLDEINEQKYKDYPILE